MKALYHKGDLVVVMSCNDMTLLVYEMAASVDRVRNTVLDHKHLAKAHKDPAVKNNHRKAMRRAMTHHRRLTAMLADLQQAHKGAF